ncbi:hypothetical protein NQ318_023577 [Aromia moschata]|uniref:Double jelly roll-like domain-containing protein n=1 Tax=Aromia moschata TaxID=1265417 RepID=A0AAV8YQ27_9CUCU|nr:hypothetical protein NQ318_023577 [Aromia moschata]
MRTGTEEFTNNCGAYLFNSVTYELNGKEIDKVRDPGTVSTIRAYLSYDRHNEISGWNFPEGRFATHHPTAHTFSLRIPLRHLFGLFCDYKKVMFGKHVLRIIRARNDNKYFKVSDNTTNGVLTINDLSLK